MERVKNYIKQLDKETQEQANKCIKDLRGEGFKWSWIYTALSIKNPEDWNKWGFGLMFNEAYRAQVTKKTNKTREKIVSELAVWQPDKDDKLEPHTLLAQAIEQSLSTLGLTWKDAAKVVNQQLEKNL